MNNADRDVRETRQGCHSEDAAGFRVFSGVQPRRSDLCSDLLRMSPSGAVRTIRSVARCILHLLRMRIAVSTVVLHHFYIKTYS